MRASQEKKEKKNQTCKKLDTGITKHKIQNNCLKIKFQSEHL